MNRDQCMHVYVYDGGCAVLRDHDIIDINVYMHTH
jgi:hypothetical protein